MLQSPSRASCDARHTARSNEATEIAEDHAGNSRPRSPGAPSLRRNPARSMFCHLALIIAGHQLASSFKQLRSD